MSEQTKKVDIPSLYALKALCALFVVAIHIPVYGKDYIAPILIVAVPCFYLISGYFLYTGNKDAEICRAMKWVKKIFLISIYINAIYFARQWMLYENTSSWKELILNIFTGDCISPHLWYLSAMWEALIAFIIVRFMGCKWLFLTLPLLLINLAFGRYSLIFFQGDSSFPQYFRLNCIAVALPYLTMGYFISKHKHSILNIKYSPIITAVCIILVYAENTVLNHFNINSNCSYFLSTALLGTSMLVTTLNSRLHIPNWITSIGKEHSANIYYFHILIGSIVSLYISPILGTDGLDTFIVYVFCIGISILLNLSFSFCKKRFSGR